MTSYGDSGFLRRLHSALLSLIKTDGNSKAARDVLMMRTKKPNEIFENVKNELMKKLDIIDFKELQPFQKDHCLFVCRKI